MVRGARRVATRGALPLCVVETKGHCLNGIYGKHNGQSKAWLDMCAGMGGFAVALEYLGEELAGHVEYGRHARTALKMSFGCKKEVHGDVWNPETLRDCLQSGFGRMTCGFNCQPFSGAGKQQGLQDARAAILQAMLIYACTAGVDAIALECVRGFAMLDDGECCAALKAALTDLGFRVRDEVVELSDRWPVKRTRWLAAVVLSTNKEPGQQGPAGWPECGPASAGRCHGLPRCWPGR